MPEQAQARHTGDVGRSQATAVDLVHDHRHPDQAAGHVQAVGGDQREERRQVGTGAGACAFVDQVRELK